MNILLLNELHAKYGDLGRLADYNGYRKACSPLTPAPALEGLAASKHPGIRWEVARNPNTPTDIVRNMTADLNGSVRYKAKRRIHSRGNHELIEEGE